MACESADWQSGNPCWRGLLSMNEAIEVADHVPQRRQDLSTRLVLAVAQNTAGNTEGARAALDAVRIPPRLAVQDIARFASPEELASLAQAGLFNQLTSNSPRE